VQLVAWTGAGEVFERPDGQPSAGGVEAGGGLRVHFEYGGVQPGVLAIDVGVPLTRRDPRVFQDGKFVRNRAPVGFYIAFDQYF
jgi:hypothetical protein